jgi:hypothetical protein
MKRLDDIIINVPFKSAGNVIRQKEVTFEVYCDNEQYSIKPILPDADRRLANLPDALDFQLVDGKPLSSRAIDANFHVIQDVVVRLREQNSIV